MCTMYIHRINCMMDIIKHICEQDCVELSERVIRIYTAIEIGIKYQSICALNLKVFLRMQSLYY